MVVEGDDEAARMLTSEAICRLPKVQLHCHLEGTVSPRTFRELAAKNGIDLGSRRRAPLGETYAFTSFREFLLLFGAVCKVLRTPDDFARVASEYALDAAEHGVAYAEIFISPSVWTHFYPELDLGSVVSAIREALDASKQRAIEVALMVDLTRNFGVERALAAVREAIALKDLGVVGIGIGGDEAAFPANLFAGAFALARDAGLRTVAHAGEVGGPQSVRSAIADLGAERIGHGVRVIADAELMEELARRKIPLEICPTSNRLTGAVAAGEPHPLAEFDARGVVCVIDADDPALFSTTLCGEYALAQEMAGSGAVLRFVRNAIAASFASESQKAELNARLDAFEKEQHAAKSDLAAAPGN